MQVYSSMSSVVHIVNVNSSTTESIANVTVCCMNLASCEFMRDSLVLLVNFVGFRYFVRHNISNHCSSFLLFIIIGFVLHGIG